MSVMPARGELQQVVEVRAGEGHALGGALHLDEAAVARHHHVHVHLGAHVLHVRQVEAGLAVDDAHADRRHESPSGSS